MITEYLRRFSQATKAAGLAVFVTCVTGLIQAALLTASVDLWIVLLVPVVVCSTTVWFYTAQVYRFRTQGLGAMLAKIAEGDLTAELPPAPDSDSEWLRLLFLKMSNALRDTTGQLRRTDLARRQLFRDLAHELGTPTATLVALADALALPEIDGDESQRKELVTALVDDGVRLSRLVGDLRELAELDDPDVSLERSVLDVGAVVRGAAERLGLAHPEAAAVEVETVELMAEVDPDRVEQIVMNLVLNAMRHTPSSGRILVVVERDGPSALVRVEDSGEGVPEHLLGRLGERLLRVDASRSRRSGGSGLGLSIVRAIVERHGGDIVFERSSLGGLRAVIRLPVAAAQPESGTTATTMPLGIVNHAR